MKSIFKQQSDIAKRNGLIFEIHSQYTIPETLKTWLIKNDINFFEG